MSQNDQLNDNMEMEGYTEDIYDGNDENYDGNEDQIKIKYENETLQFPSLTPQQMNEGVVQQSKILVPNHRLNPLKNNWMKIYQPIVEHMKLEIRFNTKNSSVELRTCQHTEDIGALQKCTDFVKAFVLGFDIDDAIALLRVEDLFIDSFEIEDVKQTLQGEHLSRAIGRIAGKDGKTKFTIENATRTRIVIADRKIHILGSFNNIKFARDAIVSLILGSPPGKVYAKLRTIQSRLRERL
jgi:RNA-binding protein PNO1